MEESCYCLLRAQKLPAYRQWKLALCQFLLVYDINVILQSTFQLKVSTAFINFWEVILIV